MKKKYKVAIAGYGIVGKRRHRSINKFNKFEVVALCDTNKDTFIGLKKSKINIFNNYKNIIEQNIDILFVCLPNNLAAETTYAAIKKNIHVFCEKPPAKKPSELKKIINLLTKKRDIKLMYGFNHRYHKSIVEAYKIIKTKKFGKIINMKGIYGKSQMISFNDKKHPSFWRTKRKISGGGVLLDQGIHMVDLMRYLGGEFRVLSSYISNERWNYDVEDNAYALLKSNNGIIAFLNSSATQWKHKFYLDINFEYGNIELKGILSGSKSYGKEKIIITKANPNNDRGNPKQLVKNYKKDNSWSDEIKTFFSSIVKNTKIKQGSIHDALNTLNLIFDIYYSDSRWRKIYKVEKPKTIIS